MKILFINPSKMGSGYTPIWIASHYPLLKKNGHSVEFFDCCLYEDWTDQYIEENTKSGMYLPSDYFNMVQLNQNDLLVDLQNEIDTFAPDVIFWSAISSHIHSEGEYVNIQYGYDLLINISHNAKLITGGIQATAEPNKILELFPQIDILIRGESEFVLLELLKDISNFQSVNGISYKRDGSIICNPPQEIISDLDVLEPYDYSLFAPNVLLRPYNGKVYKTVDYELSRGCPYSCAYCVETVIQKYYSLESNKGVLKNPKRYLRNKSAKRIFFELKTLSEKHGVEFIRAQDTNFLTINRKVLNELASLIQESDLKIFFYIETRPENINSEKVVELLKKLKVDGVAMGIESGIEFFREEELNRFVKQEKIIRAFKMLKDAGIRRTSYNILGLPGETQEMLHSSIKLNAEIKPDNISTSYFSPYIGTPLFDKLNETTKFNYIYDLDDGLRYLTPQTTDLSASLVEFYRKNFKSLVENGIENIDKN